MICQYFLRVLDGIESITGVVPFWKVRFTWKAKVQDFLEHRDIDGVIHFAASKAVGESVETLLYYENNINALVYLLQRITEKRFS
jgi:UDP-glucose 4-epimerase